MEDLAGSERTSIAEQSVKLTKECIEINKSLFTLRKVITTLTDAQTTGRSLYVPYRDSKLTCLLRQSIGGNSFSLMISCLTPSDLFFDENVSTLNYSVKAAYISNKPIKNQDPKIRLISELKKEIKELTTELEKANEHIELLSKLAEATKLQPSEGQPAATLNPDSQSLSRGAVTIHNNYNSSVIAVINKDSDPARPPLPSEGGIQIYIPGKPANSGKERDQDQDNVEDKDKDNDEGRKRDKSPDNPRLAEEFSSKSKKLNDLTDGLTAGDKERIMDRLLQSVNMVKEVLQSNLKLRAQVQELSQKVDQGNADIFHLQCENDEQKEKIQILAGMNNDMAIPGNLCPKDIVLGAKEGEGEVEEPVGKSSAGSTMPLTAGKTLSKGKINVAEEILQLKRDKNRLEQRVHYLEIENIHMRTGTSHEERPSISGTDDYEPVRSVLNGNELPHSENPVPKLSQSTGPRRPRHFGPSYKPEEAPHTSYAKVRGTNKPASTSFLQMIDTSWMGEATISPLARKDAGKANDLSRLSATQRLQEKAFTMGRGNFKSRDVKDCSPATTQNRGNEGYTENGRWYGGDVDEDLSVGYYGPSGVYLPNVADYFTADYRSHQQIPPEQDTSTLARIYQPERIRVRRTASKLSRRKPHPTPNAIYFNHE